MTRERRYALALIIAAVAGVAVALVLGLRLLTVSSGQRTTGTAGLAAGSSRSPAPAGCEQASYEITQSATGAISGCMRIGAYWAGTYDVRLRSTLMVNQAVIGARASGPPVALSISPSSGPPGTVLTVRGRLRVALAHPGAGGGPVFNWDGFPRGLLLAVGSSAHVRWTSRRSFVARVTVPRGPWIEGGTDARILGLRSGTFELGVQCVTDRGSCGLAPSEGTARFHLEVAHPPRWCPSASRCGTFTVYPRDARAGAVVRILGHAPLAEYDDGGQSFDGRVQISRGTTNGPELSFRPSAGWATAALIGEATLKVIPAPTFAGLGRARVVSETGAGLAPIAADPRDQRIVAWCGEGSVGLSVDGARSTISTRAAGSVLRREVRGAWASGQAPSCDSVTPHGATTVVAGFDLGLSARGLPRYRYLKTTDGGRTWRPVTVDPHASCPRAGPCVTFAPYQPASLSCGMSTGADQRVLSSTDHGIHWHDAPVIGGVAYTCGEAELYATGPHTVLMVNSLSPFLLQRSIDGGTSWDYVALPLPEGAQAASADAGAMRWPYNGLGPAPGGITVLPDGALLLTGETQHASGWQLLAPGASHWCPVAGAHQAWRLSQQQSQLTVIGDRLWWLVGVRDGVKVDELPLGAVRCAPGLGA